MKIIGLTGGIATGKSTVSKYLQEKSVVVLDCDAMARALLQPGQKVARQVETYFPTCFHTGNRLDREALAKFIFTHPQARKTLNRLTHGPIRRQLLRRVLCHWFKGTRMVVIDAPLLIESQLHRFMGQVVVVYCPEDVQLARLIQRNGYSKEEAELRIHAQLPIAEKIRHATHVLDNSQDRLTLYRNVDHLLRQLQPSLVHHVLWCAMPWCLVSLLLWGAVQFGIKVLAYFS